MNPKSLTLVAAALLLCLVVPVRGAPLDKRHVSADAKWLIHVDTEVLRHNALANALREQYGDEDGRRRMEQAKQDLGLASWDDLKSILFYGTTYTQGDGALIIKATVDRPAVVAKLRGKPDYAAAADGNSVRHSWTYTTNLRGKTRRHTVTLMFYPGDLAVMTRNPDDFVAAVKVLDGSAPSLADGAGRLTGAMPAGASVYSELAAPDDHQKVPPHLQKLVRQLRHLSWALVHGEDDLTLQVAATTVDPEVAMQFQHLVQGFAAMLMLHYGDKHEGLKDVIGAMRVKADGDAVRVNWPMTNEQVMRMIEHGRKGKMKHRGAHQKH